MIEMLIMNLLLSNFNYINSGYLRSRKENEYIFGIRLGDEVGIGSDLLFHERIPNLNLDLSVATIKQDYSAEVRFGYRIEIENLEKITTRRHMGIRLNTPLYWKIGDYVMFEYEYENDIYRYSFGISLEI